MPGCIAKTETRGDSFVNHFVTRELEALTDGRSMIDNENDNFIAKEAKFFITFPHAIAILKFLHITL